MILYNLKYLTLASIFLVLFGCANLADIPIITSASEYGVTIEYEVHGPVPFVTNEATELAKRHCNYYGRDAKHTHFENEGWLSKVEIHRFSCVGNNKKQNTVSGKALDEYLIENNPYFSKEELSKLPDKQDSSPANFSGKKKKIFLKNDNIKNNNNLEKKLETAKKECKEIGFDEETEEFGKCVLKLSK